MRKYGRNYELYVQETASSIGSNFQNIQLNQFVSGFLLIEPPFTIEFDVDRTIYSSADFASIKIYNLNKHNRNIIFKNQTDLDAFKQIQLQAGYGDNISIIFNGDIQEGNSVREGTDFITHCQCQGFGFAYVNAETNQSFPKGTPITSVIRSVMSDLPGVAAGAIGDYSGDLPSDRSFSGSTIKILNELTGGGLFIDNGIANCLNDDEALNGPIGVIDSTVGLLGTPTIEGGQFVILPMLFEPQIVMGQYIQLNSSTFTGLNGTNPNGVYKVVGIQHKGMISSSVCGEVVTTLKLQGGNSFDIVNKNANI